MAMESFKAAMYLCPVHMMLVSAHLVAEVHQHTVIQFTCSLDGNPFSVWTEKEGWQATDAVLINSNVSHSLKDFKGWQLTACVMPDARKGKTVQDQILNGNAVRYFTKEELAPLIEELQLLKQQKLDRYDQFQDRMNFIYNTLLGNPPAEPALDERIAATLIRIREGIAESISAATLASAVHLSEHRFLHLFKEQMGVPLRQYILWQRLAAGTRAFIEGKSSKEAAYEAGFSDPAHFSRTFAQMFGAQPSSYAAFKSQFYMVVF